MITSENYQIAVFFCTGIAVRFDSFQAAAPFDSAKELEKRNPALKTIKWRSKKLQWLPKSIHAQKA